MGDELLGGDRSSFGAFGSDLKSDCVDCAALIVVNR